MTAHLRERWRKVAVADGSTPPPQAPETAPVPDEHVRLWHRTPLRNADSIRRSGLGAEHSRQLEFSGEMVWGTFGWRSAIGDAHQAAMTDWAFVEYHVPWDVHGPWPTPGGAYTSGSVPPSNIIAVWEPWHFAVWVLVSEMGGVYETLEDLDFLRRDGGPPFAQALDWLATHQAPAWMREVKP